MSGEQKGKGNGSSGSSGATSSYARWANDMTALVSFLRSAREKADALGLEMYDEIDRLVREADNYARGIPNA